MANYDRYIELDPRYESVVDLKSDERNPNLWQDYIVHNDMAIAMDKICESLKNENKDARRSFWVHGTYGTGKSYSAIVIKHLFEDDITKIEPFLEKPRISQYKNRFSSIREKGGFLVVWRSGATDIMNGMQLLMAAEMSIRDGLKRKFGDKAYYGTHSIRQAIDEKLKDKDINWDVIFENPAYGLSDTFNSMAEVREAVASETESGTMGTISLIAGICRDKGWALNSTVEQFEAWSKDVIDGNNLEKGGIIFVWDEFTDYLTREASDSNVLQRLSELCKKTPLFMFLIVHKDPAVVGRLGEDTYQKIMHRFHELEFHISQDAAYDLIGETIKIRDGMKEDWEHIKSQKLSKITITDFANIDGGKTAEQIKSVFPIHPMTLSLLTTVVQNFAASERTLFKFMKDKGIGVGFPYFIGNNNEDEWAWLTADFLWDYFFMQSSDLRETGTEAAKAYRHYKKAEDDRVFGDSNVYSEPKHVFKAAMLLIAVMSTSNISGLRSRISNLAIQATRNTLYKCFQGQLSTTRIDEILAAFKNQELLRLDEMPARNDARLELPYTSTNGDLFESKLALIKKNNSRYLLFNKQATFAKAVEEKLWDKNLATFNRIVAVCATNETMSINARLVEVTAELNKSPYKIGVFCVAMADADEWQPLFDKLKNIAHSDKTERLFVCALKDPLTVTKLEEWYQAKTHAELARESGKKDSGESKDMEAEVSVQTWASSATGGVIAAYYKDRFFACINGRDQLRHKVEEEVLFQLFPFAPERIVTQNTAFKPAQENAAYAAIAPSKASVNTQISNIINGLKSAGVFEVNSLGDLESQQGTAQSRVVANLAKTIRETLSDGGAKVILDELWMKLQSPPFGLYNTLASAYLLGFVFKFYKDGEFHWMDGSNPHPLNEDTIKTMVYKICRGEVSNHYLSAGTEAWRQFRSYAIAIFSLSDAEAANAEESIKHIRERMVAVGVPFWALKYIAEEKYGGTAEKAIAIAIIEKIDSFISGQPAQEEIMASVVTFFKGKGKLKKILNDLYSDKNLCYEAFLNFVYLKNTTIKDRIEAIGLKRNEFFDAIRQSMQGGIYLWTEDMVVERLASVEQDLEIVSLLNKATDIKGKTVASIGNILSNKFSLMKVPGKVIEGMGYKWSNALACLHEISIGRISNLTGEDKSRYIEVLKPQGEEAWQHVCAAKITLKDYIHKKGFNFTDREIDYIYSELKEYPYDQNTALYETEVMAHIDNIEDARRKEEIKDIWKIKSGFSTIDEWCEQYSIPVLWFMKSGNEGQDALRIIKAIQNKDLLSSEEVKRALEYLQINSLNFLRDDKSISDVFFREIGEKYRKIFIIKRDTILARIRFSVGANAYDWAMRVGEIQAVFEEFQKEEGKKAIENIKKTIERFDTEKLQKCVATLLDEHPELYEFFVEDGAK